MKNTLFTLLFFTGIANAQIVTIPDNNFKAKLLIADVTNQVAYSNGGYIKIDANNDGQIQESEAVVVDSLNVQGVHITNLSGISSFSNLKGLTCSNNDLTAVDVTSLSQLQVLRCDYNQLTALNVFGLNALTHLDCGFNYHIPSIDFSGTTNIETLVCNTNELASIDVSAMTNLTYLNCGSNLLQTLNVNGLINLRYLQYNDNMISGIDLSGLINLENLSVSNNPMTAGLDLHGLTNLKYLNCFSNQLTSLDLSGLTNLLGLTCFNNQITSLDVSEVPNLTGLYCSSNQLTTLDVSNLHYLTGLSVMNNPMTTLFIKNGANEELYLNGITTFQYICADESQIAAIHDQLVSFPNVVVNSYCSFTPGGDYNTIMGNIKYDLGNDGCDAGDVISPYMRVDINDGSFSGASFANNSGNYVFYTQAGSFDVTPSLENPDWFTFSPPTTTIPFADNNNNMANQDFCITANGTHPDIEIVIAPIQRARPGFDAIYQLVYRNKGNQTLSGNITYTYDDAVLDFVSATMTPDTQNTGLLNWNYSDLKPFESRSFYVTLNVNGPTETPAVNVGDALHCEATITPVIGDETPNDNLSAYKEIVIGSYDPNDITCLEGAVVTPSEIGNYLHYAINFENTGTYPAENVVVKTEVDASKFDINSLQLMHTNFPVDARITGNVVEFIFENINLQIGGHGHILLKIKTKNTLVTGDAVAKRADIFFDYNAPVDTGFANTVFQNLSNADFETDESISIYPNPANNEVVVSSDNNIKSIQLYDVQGRILKTSLINDVATKLDISSHSKGVYFIKITTEKGIKVQKLLKN